MVEIRCDIGLLSPSSLPSEAALIGLTSSSRNTTVGIEGIWNIIYETEACYVP